MVFLPPFSNNIIKECIDSKLQTQIAGFDLTIRDIMNLSNGGEIDLDNSNRKIPDHETIKPVNNKWKLKAGGYLVRYNEIVEVPLDAVGIVLPRSSLMRIGGTLCSAVWDPGYKGRGVGLMITYADITFHENARIAQIMFIKTQKETEKGYSGTYQNER